MDNGQISAGSTITSAIFRLYKNGDASTGSKTASVYRMIRAYVNAQATWNVYSTGNNWGTAGANNTTTDREGSATGTRVFVNGEGTGSYADFTLTAANIQAMIINGGFTNNGFLVRMNTQVDDGWSFVSTDGTAANRPELVVNYTPPSGFFDFF